MPIYEYECAGCNHVVERISKDLRPLPFIRCHECGGLLLYRISAPKFHVRGYNESNWYSDCEKGE